MGSYEFQLAKVVGSRDQCIVGEILPSSTIKKQFKNASMTISATEMKDGYGQMQFSSQLDFEAKSNLHSIFFTLSKGEGNKQKIVYKSESQKYKNKGYKFKMILTNTDTLANSDPNTDIIITVYRYNKEGNHKKITTQPVNFAILQNGNGTSPSIKNNLGNFVFNNVEIKKKVSFLDYIFGGCDVSLHINIDFTLSNGAP